MNDYLKTLNASWLKHLEPKSNLNPTVISLFAGGGGSSLGYSMAGFKELMAVEYDKDAVITFQENIPNVPVWFEDISLLTGKNLLSLTCLQKGQLDLLDASPPCCGFSGANHWLKDTDKRNDYYRFVLDIVKDIVPKTVVLENVPNFASSKHQKRYSDFMKQITSFGYSANSQIINSIDYGVPQSRRRLFIIGVRNDIGSPLFPESLETKFTVRDAIGDLPLGVEDNRDQKIKQKWIDRNPKGIGSNMSVRLDWNKSSPTQLAGRMKMHPEIFRFLSIREVARIQSFPDQFKFSLSKTASNKVIGNSVCPLVSMAIGQTIRENILQPD